MDNKLTILITGVFSGIGNAVMNYFCLKGHEVYGIDICPFKHESLHFFMADITNENQLLEIKEELSKQNIHFDLILNFAGIHKMGSFIESDINDIKKVIDINLIGTILVNKTFYSLLKKNGRIIITTSEVAPLDPMPFNGIYHISKTALDCYSQSLRQELHLQGQKVITIRPGAILTPLCQNSSSETEKFMHSTHMYQKESKHFHSLIKKFMGTPMDSNQFARFIYKVSLKKHPKLIYNKHHNFLLKGMSLLPKRWQCAIIKKLLKK